MGDDVFGEDPTTNRLEEMAADSFADYVRDEKGWNVTVPADREEIIID